MSGFLLDTGKDLKLESYQTPLIMRYTHVHPQYELYFCPQKIEQLSVINGMEHCYCSPCVILSTPYTIHSMSCDERAEEYERYVLYFSEKTLQAFSSRLLPLDLTQQNAGLFFELQPEQADELRGLIELALQAKSLVEQELILLLFLNRLLTHCPKEKILSVGASSSYIQDVLQYLAEHFSESVDQGELLRHFGVSRSKLDRDFKRITGITVHQFLDTCRLNHAKYLLQHRSALSVVEIAQACGFTSENYFFPFFKKHTGMTPAEYRQEQYNKEKGE